MYTRDSPPHDKRCRGTHSWCLLTLVPAPPEKVIPLQYPGKEVVPVLLTTVMCDKAWPAPRHTLGSWLWPAAAPGPQTTQTCGWGNKWKEQTKYGGRKEEREIGLVKSLNIGDFFVNVIRRYFLQGIQLILSFDWYQVQWREGCTHFSGVMPSGKGVSLLNKKLEKWKCLCCI